MKLNRFDNVSLYYERVKGYLLKHEAHHCLLLGLVNALIHAPERFDRQPYLAVIEEDDTIVTVALRTPPNNLVLSRCINPQALAIIAQEFHQQQVQVPGVHGPAEEASTLAKVWQEVTGQSYRVAMQQRIYQLETVQPMPKANGYFRQVTQADRDQLIRWTQAFEEEALGSTDRQDAERFVDRRLQEGSLYIWQDDAPVSMAGYSGLTPNGIRVNPVYTPPEYRRQGYASSCVAALSQVLLNQGRKYCFLLTDLANPTSNYIYQNIGYQPVGDATEYCFG
jgi:predicted GNAT family acetyltransferase